MANACRWRSAGLNLRRPSPGAAPGGDKHAPAIRGGHEAHCQLVFAGFDSLQLLSRTVCRPFDAGRDGFVIAEGAGVSGGYIKVPLYKEPDFLQHGFFAGRWPVKEMGLTPKLQ